jgi:hypothetical protein
LAILFFVRKKSVKVQFVFLLLQPGLLGCVLFDGLGGMKRNGMESSHFCCV